MTLNKQQQINRDEFKNILNEFNELKLTVSNYIKKLTPQDKKLKEVN